MILPTDSAKRKEYPIYSGCLAYFPRAIAAVANQSYVNNEKHNPGEAMHWAKEKSNDHLDCMARHMLDQLDEQLDPMAEKVATAWRAMAELEIALELRDDDESDELTAYDGAGVKYTVKTSKPPYIIT